MVRRNERPDMTIAVDWDVGLKHQTKTKTRSYSLLLSIKICVMSGFIYCKFLASVTAE